MTGFMRSARQAASLGADIIKKWLGKNIDYRLKAPADQVTAVDMAVEEALVGYLRGCYPDHFILAEEGHGDYELLHKPDAFVWVLDPLDGTANFIRKWPMSAVSVALVQNGRPLVGVVRHAFYDEEFWALTGGGAWLNQRPITVSANQVLAHAMGGFAFPFRNRAKLPAFMELFRQIFDQVEDVRRSGSAALDLAYVASGRTDFYFETGLKPWDVAAGILLVQEAGGLVTDFAGGGRCLLEGDILATNKALHNNLLEFTHPFSGLHLR